jgi:hypothetical protein
MNALSTLPSTPDVLQLTHQPKEKSIMNTYINESRRQDLIDQYIDCHEETGGEDSDGLRICLNCLSNPELVKYCQESGWGIA